MAVPIAIEFCATDFDKICEATGKISVLVSEKERTGAIVKRLDKRMRGAISRAMEGKAWGKLKAAEAMELFYPTGLKAEAVQLVKLPKKVTLAEARKAGAAIGKIVDDAGVTVLAANHPRSADVSLGLVLRAYEFSHYHTDKDDKKGPVTFHVDKPESVRHAAAPMSALAEGVCFTRDLVNEPANVLTTMDFATRIKAMEELGLKVEIFEEDQLGKLGMRALLAVGQGSESPSKVAVIQWNGGKKGQAPFALVGKGVVFDTGGISIKPAAGMEEMTMDMGGAGVVAGVMRTLALRKAKANVVGVVGLVENMPDGRAQRPGDVVKSMKGDTIEVINTDAEGRLVLADALTYASRLEPDMIVDAATLTGACVVALGNTCSGYYATTEDLSKRISRAASVAGESFWRMPLLSDLRDQLKSDIADLKHTGERWGGSITAALFLKEFVGEVPWAHCDIAGPVTADRAKGIYPAGATGHPVLTFLTLVEDLG